MTQQQSIEQLPPPATTTVATNAATIETTEAPAAATTEAATAADAPAVTTTTVTAVRRLKSKQRLAAVMRDLASAKERYKLRLQRQQALEQQRFNPPSEDELMEAAILAALHENQMTVEEKEEQKKRQQLVKLRHQQVAAALHKASENFTRLQEFKENPPPQWHLPAQCSSDMATTTRKKNQSSVSTSQYHRSSATELMRLAKSIEELKKREEIEAQQQRTQDPVKKRQSPLRSVQIHQSIDDAAFIDDAVYSTVMSKLRNIRTALVTVLQQVISEDNVKEFGDLYLLHTFLRHGDDSSVLRLLKCSELLLKYKIDDLLMRRLKRQSQRRLNAITAEDTTKSQFDDGEVSPPAYEDLMIDLRYDSSHSRDPSSFDDVTSTLAELIEDQQKQQAVGSLLHSMVRLLEQNDVDVSCFASEESKTNKEGDQLSVPQSIEQALCISFEQMILLPQVFQLLYPDTSSEGPQNSCIADTERHFLQAMSKLNDYAAFSREMLATELRSVPYDQRREGVFARIIDQSNCFSVPFALQMIEFGSKILLKPCSILELVAVFDRKQRGFLGVSEFRQLLEVSLGNAIDRRKYFRAIHELNPSSYVSLDSILSFIYSLWKTQLKYLHHQLQSKSVKEELQQKQMLFYELCKESMKFNFPREWRDEFTLHDELSYSTRQMLQEMRLSEIMMIGGFRQHMDMMNHQQCNCQILSCKNSLLSSANRYNTYTLSDFDQSKRDALQDHCIKAGMASVDAVYAHRDAVRDASSKLKNTNQGTKIKESARSILPHEQNVDLKINSSSGRRIKTSDGDYLRVKVVQFVDPPDDIA